MKVNAAIEPKKDDRAFDWVNIIFLTVTPVLALLLPGIYIYSYGLHWMDFLVYFIMYLATGMGVTAGYHRYYAHRSYDCGKAVQLFYLLFGAAAIQNSVLKWARDHRIHHSRVDEDEDPYNIMRGFLYAHIGWIFFKTPVDRNFTCAPDLMKDPLVRWQDRYYLPILVLIGFGLPTLIGWTVGRPFGGFLFGGLVRVVIVQHMTFCINSVAHYVGTRPYSLDNTARDSWWLAFITYGEGYHNFHHRFAADFRNGHRWYHFDPTKWLIQSLSKLGLVTRMTAYREEHILKARIETDIKRVQQKLADAPEELSVRIERRMHDARVQLEAAYASWEETKVKYRAMRKSMLDRSQVSREQWNLATLQWKLRIKQHGFQFQAAQARWALLIAAFGRFSGHGPLSKPALTA